MKILTILLFYLTIIACERSEINSSKITASLNPFQTDVEKDNLNGKVLTTRSYYNDTLFFGNVFLERRYNKSGFMTYEIFSSPHVSSEWEAKSFNYRGQPITTLEKYFYYEWEDTSIFLTKHSYTPLGLKKMETTGDNKTYYWYNIEKRIRKTSFYSKGNLYKIDVEFFDNQNRLIAKYSKEFIGTKFNLYSSEIQYSKQKKISTLDWINEPCYTPLEYNIEEYDGNGNITSMYTTHKGDTSISNQIEFSYEFDNHQNWIKQLFVKGSLARIREITYYD